MWRAGLLKYDEEVGIEWEWQVMDSAMTKAPLGEEGTGPNPTDRGKKGTKRSLLTEGKGIPSWLNRFRRLLIRWEKKKMENYLAMLHFACALITFRAAGVFG